MSLRALREDALHISSTATEVLVSLPWIRSMPLACVSDLTLTLDGERNGALAVRIGDRAVAPRDLDREDAWWFVQDRLVLTAPPCDPSTAHEVAVSFTLLVPYLPGGPTSPLRLPMADAMVLTPHAGRAPAAGRTVR